MELENFLNRPGMIKVNLNQDATCRLCGYTNNFLIGQAGDFYEGNEVNCGSCLRVVWVIAADGLKEI